MKPPPTKIDPKSAASAFVILGELFLLPALLRGNRTAPKLADQQMSAFGAAATFFGQGVEIGMPLSGFYLSGSTAGLVDTTIETGSDAGKVFLSASSSAS